MNEDQLLNAVKTIKEKTSGAFFDGIHKLEVEQYLRDQAFILGATYSQSKDIASKIMDG